MQMRHSLPLWAVSLADSGCNTVPKPQYLPHHSAAKTDTQMQTVMPTVEGKAIEEKLSEFTPRPMVPTAAYTSNDSIVESNKGMFVEFPTLRSDRVQQPSLGNNLLNDHLQVKSKQKGQVKRVRTISDRIK